MEVSYNVLVGDVRTQLAEIADKTVQCVITSPPYWGLRDYGTASWEGGDAECDHAPDKRGSRFATPVSGKQGSNKGSGSASRRDCDCGAVRIDDQMGLETTPQEYVDSMVAVFREVKRVLSDEGTLWLNIGDSYASFRDGKVTPDTARGESVGTSVEKGKASNRKASTFGNTSIKHKDLVGIPWMLAFALRADGWYLRQEIIWAKPNPMPESVKDRCTKSHEQIFLLTKSPKYYFDNMAIREPQAEATIKDIAGRKTLDNKGTFGGVRADLGRSREEYVPSDGLRNKRSVWTVNTKPFKAAHFATFPPELIRPMILAGTSEFGKCDQCGNQFVREIETGTIAERQTRDSTIGVIPGRDSVTRLNSVNMETLPKKHIGWEPSCECVEAKAVPCLVLDPFAGAGTTLFVANEEGRNAIGVELNDEYVKIIHARINKLPQKLF